MNDPVANCFRFAKIEHGGMVAQAQKRSGEPGKSAGCPPLSRSDRVCPECPWASSPPIAMKNLGSVFWIRHPDRSRRFGGGAEGPAFSPRAHSLNRAGQMSFDRAKSKGWAMQPRDTNCPRYPRHSSPVRRDGIRKPSPPRRPRKAHFIDGKSLRGRQMPTGASETVSQLRIQICGGIKRSKINRPSRGVAAFVLATGVSPG